MARPRGGYDIDGEAVPGISTVSKVGEDQGGLMHWHWHEGHAWTGTYKQWKTRADQPTDFGTQVHDLFETWLFQRDLFSEDLSAYPQPVQVSFGAARAWAEQSKVEVTHTELSMISRRLRVGGTIDAAVRVGGQRAIADWKSSKAIYNEMKVQLAGYGLVWDECYPSDPVTGGFHLVRFDKETGVLSIAGGPPCPGPNGPFGRSASFMTISNWWSGDAKGWRACSGTVA